MSKANVAGSIRLAIKVPRRSGGTSCEHEIFFVRRFIREVHPGDETSQQTAREHADQQVRCLPLTLLRPRHAAGHDRVDREPAFGGRRHAAETIAALVERDAPIVGRMPETPRGVRLPDLDDPVGHGSPAPSRSDPWTTMWRPSAAGEATISPPSNLEPEIEEWTNRLRGRDPAHSALHRGGVRSPQDNIEVEAEGPLGLRRVDREVGDETLARPLVRNRVEDRIERQQGITGKYIWVISRVRKLVPKSEKWMCAGRQAL